MVFYRVFYIAHPIDLMVQSSDPWVFFFPLSYSMCLVGVVSCLFAQKNSIQGEVRYRGLLFGGKLGGLFLIVCVALCEALR